MDQGRHPESPSASAPSNLTRRARREPTVPTLIRILFGIALALSVFLIVAGFGLWRMRESEMMRSTGYLGLLLTLCVAPVVYSVERLRRASATSRAVEMKLGDLADAMRRLTEQSALSDDARRVLNRQAERELLCRTIEQDIVEEDWDAALVLCRELAERFGYRAEAEGYRGRIDSARSEVLERKVNDAVAHLDGLIVQRRWDDAIREARRIGRLFPDSPRVDALQHRVEQARNVYKSDLQRRFLDTTERNEIDVAMDLLKELDSYLSQAEAEPYRELARGVIDKAKSQLGTQFKQAVEEKRWADAAAAGRRIMNEFPNTRMATEVRGMLDTILSKANTSHRA